MHFREQHSTDNCIIWKCILLTKNICILTHISISRNRCALGLRELLAKNVVNISKVEKHTIRPLGYTEYKLTIYLKPMMSWKENIYGIYTRITTTNIENIYKNINKLATTHFLWIKLLVSKVKFWCRDSNLNEKTME